MDLTKTRDFETADMQSSLNTYNDISIQLSIFKKQLMNKSTMRRTFFH